MSRTYHHGDNNKYRLYGNAWHWYANEPKWWRNLMKHRPKRTEERDLLSKVMVDGEDDGIWPLDKKPWRYYW